MESRQKSATEWLQFCWDFVKPRWNSFATFFFLACSSARIFFYVICAACNFFLPTSACRNFFFKITHPPPPQELNGQPLKFCYLYPALVRRWYRLKNSCTAASKKKNCCKAISSGLYKIPATELQPFSGWFLMRLHFCIRICLKFFSPGWYVITKGTILPLVC